MKKIAAFAALAMLTGCASAPPASRLADASEVAAAVGEIRPGDGITGLATPWARAEAGSTARWRLVAKRYDCAIYRSLDLCDGGAAWSDWSYTFEVAARRYLEPFEAGAMMALEPGAETRCGVGAGHAFEYWGCSSNDGLTELFTADDFARYARDGYHHHLAWRIDVPAYYFAGLAAATESISE